MRIVLALSLFWMFAAWLRPATGADADKPTEVPAPAALYQDPDPFARSGQTVDLNSMDDPMRGLTEKIAAEPGNYQFWAERGYLRADRGDRKGAEADYAQAIKLAEGKPKQLRFAHWSFGWALLGLEKPEAALAEWRQSERLHGGHPYWVPYTYAVGLWAAGRQDEAVAYYAAAARSFPERWSTREAVRTHSARMKPEEQALMLEVFGAWEAKKK